MTPSNVRLLLLFTYTKPCTSAAPTRQASGNVLFRKDPRHSQSRVHAAGRKPKTNLKRNKPKHNQILDDFILERSARVPHCRGWPPLIRCPSGACPLVPAGARWCPRVPLPLPLLPAAAPVPDCRGWPPLIRCPSCSFPLVPTAARLCL